MATVIQHGNVLEVHGTDVVDAGNYLNRPGLRSALFGIANPLGNLQGQVDFIICFVVNGSQADHSGVFHSFTPRPLRGIIQLPDDLRNMTVNRLGGVLSGGVAHEVGHYHKVEGQVLTLPSGGGAGRGARGGS